MTGLMERLKARWILDGLTLRSGASPEALDDFESRYRVSLPPAVRDYFASVDGTGDDSDNAFLRFWPLAEVIPILEYNRWGPNEAPGYKDWFYFADFMFGSHSFAVRLTADPIDGGPVVFEDGCMIPLASCFAEFLDRYLSDRDGLRYYLTSGPG